VSPLEAGILALIIGCIAGYIFHGWEFDRQLEKLNRQYDALERRIKGTDE
jgi:hypothetical protein